MKAVYTVTFVQLGNYANTDIGIVCDIEMPKQWVFANLEAAKKLFLLIYKTFEEEAHDDMEMEEIDRGYAYASFLNGRSLFLRKQEILDTPPSDGPELWEGMHC